MSAETSRAVFLSYASQDAVAVERIAEALRATGIEVWFDKDELVGGDAWDQKIRRQIKECALFVPVISANTNARPEGYFRLEWKLAVDRSHLMSDDHPFLFPVVIDDTSDAAARVPDRFRDVQWTRLNVKDTPESLAARVAKILGGAGPAEIAHAARRGDEPASQKSQPRWLRHAWAIFGLVMGLFWIARPLWNFGGSRGKTSPPAVEKSAAPAPKISEARQLAEKARGLFDKLDSNADDFAVAESLLKRALELDATDGEIWAYSARLNAGFITRSFENNTTRRETARNHAERAVKLAPESAEAWHALGRAIWTTDLPRAEEALRHALQLAPDDGRILISLGSVCRNQGHNDDALAFYVRAAAQPAVRPLALYDQFLIHLYLRRFAEAERCGREAATLLPTTNSITGLALLEIAWRGRVDAAQRILADAPAAMRAEPRMVFATALIALMAKQTDEALRALDRLPGDFINDAWYAGPKSLLVGLAHAQAGRAEAARIAWETGLALVRSRLQATPNDADLHLRLGELLAWSGQTEAAIREARVFEELARNRTDWTFSSARIYAALGRADDALPILEKILTVTASGRWPLTPALLRLDPLWDKIRDDPRFQKLAASDAPSTGAVAPKPDDKSVAVLAFADNSPAHDSEYFSDGISEELINALGKVPGLKVPARTSSFYFKGKSVPVPEIAQQLGVAYVIEGSVQRLGDKVKIGARLTKAADGFQAWTDSFTRDAKDVFAVEEEIAGLIAKNLELKLGATPQSAKAVNPEAHRLVLEGRQFWNLRTDDGFTRAEAAFRRAIAIDPEFALAHAGLADVLVTRAVYQSYAGLPSGAGPEVRAAAQRALALDPALAEARPALGVLGMFEGRFVEAEQEFQRAFAGNPNYALAHHWYSLLLELQGRLDLALVEIDRALQLDPLSVIAQLTRGRYLMHAQRFAEALAGFDEVRVLQSDYPPAVSLSAEALFRLGRAAEATAVAQSLADHATQERRLTSDAEALHVLRAAGRAAEAAAYAERVLPRLPADNYKRGAVLAALGRWDEAVPLLERTPVFMHYIFFWSPVWDAWRDDPRFTQLLAKLGCTEEYKVARATLTRMLKESSSKK